MELHKNILPFKCDNHDCGKEYDISSFADVVLLWGYIYLISEEDEVGLVGLTCPECKKTTLRKYHAYAAMALLWDLANNLKQNHICFYNMPVEDRWGGKYFSADHLLEAGYIRTTFPAKNEDDQTIYYIPAEVKIEEYSKTLQKSRPYSISESAVPFVLDIENLQKYKAIPRTFPKAHLGIPPVNLYSDLDTMMLNQTPESVNASLRYGVKPNDSLYERIDEEHPGTTVSYKNYNSIWKRKELSENEEKILLEHNDLLREEVVDFSISDLSWKRKAFQENFQDFIAELKDLRNRIDCELIFRNQLINKYGRLFYHRTMTIEEQRLALAQREEQKRLEDERANEPYAVRFGEAGITAGGQLELTRSIPINWMHGPELMDRLNLDTFGILNLIQHYDLIAYDSINSIFIDKASLNPALRSEFTAGDVEQQKNAMQRLCFHRDNINAFEEFYSENFAWEAYEMEKATQTSSSSDRAKTDFTPDDAGLTTKEEALTSIEKVKKCCREVASQFLAKNPKMTVADIIRSEEFLKCFEGTGVDVRGERRLRDWISDIEHDDSPGRRPGT